MELDRTTRTFLVFFLCLALEVSNLCESSMRIVPSRRRVSLSRCRGVRYSRLGCFTLDPPFNNTQWLPQSPSVVNTRFLLYTRHNPTTGHRLDADNSSSITSSHLTGDKDIKILIHGFLQYGSMEFLVNMTEALLHVADVNVVVVDWGDGAGFPYTRAVANARLVAAQTSRLLNSIFQLTGANSDRVHLIGHSLGAHVAGYVGASIPGISRITGLDPAQPNFSGFSQAVRLDPTDASFVDVIHTDAEPYDTVRGYGMIEPVGHVDFYPNGGRAQPGCQEETSVLGFMEDVVSNGITDAEFHVSCSHERSTELFTASIRQTTFGSCQFTSYPCSSAERFWQGECRHCGNRPCPVMGYHADLYFRSRGSYYLNTTGSQPFCTYHYVVTLRAAPRTDNLAGTVMFQLTGSQGSVGWMEMTSGQQRISGDMSRLVVVHFDIGDVTRVDIRFLSADGQTDQRLVDVQWIEVDNMMHNPTRYFRQPSMSVGWEPPLSVTSWTYTPPYS
ncbi:Pancreatic lipase- protein 2 [Biomphalaria glabrata]|uniref:Pancreatic triacylglycerol lipase-like n=2 Tax=Biomphalaria glabrata TaxID=6526 RepID=A0A9W3ACW3_BIOGL|nr:pancreatic triacylglycerol lipase-like [Biomphalaria glabrata]KAI8754465.1 pancreatic lipase-related protein 2-like; partial [Biomphalaria glabrata]KAI8774315.1 pancreatic lipase-related protein 2 [Biomphalaria glabrata]